MLALAAAARVYNVAVHIMRRDFFAFELHMNALDGRGARLEVTV
jgi:hypothetical protein